MSEELYAFPRPDERAPDGTGIMLGNNGMTLRDWFAGQCLPTLAADYQSRPEHVVSRAYEIADAMLKAREIKP